MNRWKHGRWQWLGGGRWTNGKPGGQDTGGQRLPCLLSKKFLWEELELVREEVTFIYQKLRECPKPMAGRAGWRSFYSFGPLKSPPPTEAQEQEITENLVNIQKMQKTQVKCRKVSRAGWGGRGDSERAGIRLLSDSDRHKCAATLLFGASEIHPLVPISLHVSHADEIFA